MRRCTSFFKRGINIAWPIARSYADCIRVQYSGVVPKYKLSRNAVSTVIPRRSFTISDMRVAGTRNDNASAFTERSKGFRKSSRKYSPGCIATNRSVFFLSTTSLSLVIIHHLDVARILTVPFETDSKLLVDADAPLSEPVTPQPFQPFAGRVPKFLHILCGVDVTKSPRRHPCDRRKAPALSRQEDLSRLFVPERYDHATSVAR